MSDNLKRTIFETLSSINVSDITKDRNGFTYLSWANAWAEVKKIYPDAEYEVEFFDGKPFFHDKNLGYMVFTNVSIDGLNHRMWLPVMDGANKAMKDHEYTYKVKEYANRKPTGNFIDKSVDKATMGNINKAIMRCLAKNIAMHGLGIYIYTGEDCPEVPEITESDLIGLSHEQIFKKYNISIVKASKVLENASGMPFDAHNPLCFSNLNENQKQCLDRPDIIHWLSFMAPK